MTPPQPKEKVDAKHLKNKKISDRSYVSKSSVDARRSQCSRQQLDPQNYKLNKANNIQLTAYIVMRELRLEKIK